MTSRRVLLLLFVCHWHICQRLQIHTVLTSAARICCYLIRGKYTDEHDDTLCSQQCKLCTYSSAVYFFSNRMSWILHEAHLNLWNSHLSPNAALISYVLLCSSKYGPSSARLNYSSPGMVWNSAFLLLSIWRRCRTACLHSPCCYGSNFRDKENK